MPLCVMPGLVPGIHVFPLSTSFLPQKLEVHCRDKPGHDPLSVLNLVLNISILVFEAGDGL